MQFSKRADTTQCRDEPDLVVIVVVIDVLISIKHKSKSTCRNIFYIWTIETK